MLNMQKCFRKCSSRLDDSTAVGAQFLVLAELRFNGSSLMQRLEAGEGNKRSETLHD